MLPLRYLRIVLFISFLSPSHSGFFRSFVLSVPHPKVAIAFPSLHGWQILITSQNLNYGKLEVKSDNYKSKQKGLSENCKVKLMTKYYIHDKSGIDIVLFECSVLY